MISFVAEAVELSACLSTNFDECKINELWSTTDQKFVVCCFPEAPPMELIMEQFWIMTHICKNCIFIDFWKKNFTVDTVTSQSSDIVLKDAVNKVWSNVFDQCVDLLRRLKNYSLSLMTVDQLFKGKSSPVITENITQLCRGVELCQSGSETDDCKWIHGVVERMNQFWQLCQFDDAARVFLDVRDALNLTGDFKLVDKVASQVRHSYADIYITYMNTV